MSDLPTEPLYPHVIVPMIGEDGNAFSILARVRSALKRAGEKDAAEAFASEATRGDYDHLLRTVLRYVETDDDERWTP